MHVTVLMSVYNEENRVRQAIDSIQSQTFTDWDLLIIDDASTDSTPEVLCEFAIDRRISIVRNPTNLGLAASLNIGWRMAQGDLIARMDADDICLPHRLEQQVAFMKKQPDVSVLGGGAELTDASGHDLGRALRPETHTELVSRFLTENPFMHPTVMVRRCFFEALGGYDERLRRAQDYDLWARGIRRFRYHNLQESLIRYRMREKPGWETILWGSYAHALAASRERGFLIKYWYPFRFLAANTLYRLGLRKVTIAVPD